MFSPVYTSDIVDSGVLVVLTRLIETKEPTPSPQEEEDVAGCKGLSPLVKNRK